MSSLPLNKMHLQFQAKSMNNGFSVEFNNENFANEYPDTIWNKAPLEIQEFLIDNLAFATTMHLGMVYPNVRKLVYNTSRPLLEPYFNQNFLFDIPSDAEVDGNPIPDEVKKFFHLQTEFRSQVVKQPGTHAVDNANKALFGLSFG